MRLRLFRHAYARIADEERCVYAGFYVESLRLLHNESDRHRLDNKSPAGSHSISGILSQVHDHSLDLPGIHFYKDIIRSKLGPHLDLGAQP